MCDFVAVVRRRVQETGTVDKTCDICGHVGLRLVETHSVRRGAALLNPGFKADRHSYELCGGCGVRYRVKNGVRI